MSPYFRNLLKSIGHDYMAPDARVYNTKQYLDGGRVGFENGKKVKTPDKTPEQYNKNLEQKIQLDNFDPKDRKLNASGGLNYLMGL